MFVPLPFTKEHVDSLYTFPDRDRKFKSIPDDVKKQFLLNVDAQVFDETGSKLHPYQYNEVFLKDVWCIMDVSMKLYVNYNSFNLCSITAHVFG